jgi:multiple sugar transport system substrate-binding protein
LIDPYLSANTNSKIKYVQIDPAQYRTKLLAALAAGTGPDIFEIGSRELPQWQSVLYPLPPQPQGGFNLISLEGQFPSVVEQDFSAGGQIYALPFSVDTLAMIYNKDIFDSAGVAFPPKTWDDFQKDVAQLRIVNPQGQITRAAAAIGGSAKSISNASDILFLLMMQNGTQMVGKDLTTATFARGSGSQSTGLAAFNFYLQFANAASPYYTWNDGMGNALDSFVQGNTAIVFDYKSALADIKARAPFLNVGIAPMPQPTGATIFLNYAKYKGLAVARTVNYSAAWSFVLNLTTQEANEKIYTNDTGEPPALRTVISENVNDPVLSIFAAQALTARSWREVNDSTIDGIISSAIQGVLNGSVDPARALTQAEEAVNEIAIQ